MKVEQSTWHPEIGWETPSVLKHKANLVFAFGSREMLAYPSYFEKIRERYPKAHILSASTAGNILSTNIVDDSVVVTAIAFEVTPIQVVQTKVDAYRSSFDAGKELAMALPQKGLKHVFVLSDGQQVNGSQLVKGMLSVLPPSTSLTGGLAGDGEHFQMTLVGLDEPPLVGKVAALGLYGDQIKIGFGSVGGWDPFGPERKVTRSQGNRLYELDNCSALELYKAYLGEHASELPASALLFPLSIRLEKSDHPLVRTVLNIDEKEGSMIFAGDIPEGCYAQFMKANFERVIDGAFEAANQAYEMLGAFQPDLALLVSCVGRRMVLRERTEEELESIEDILGKGSAMTGFYSYGEIAPTAPHASCELHNQTMTITTLREVLSS